MFQTFEQSYQHNNGSLEKTRIDNSWAVIQEFLFIWLSRREKHTFLVSQLITICNTQLLAMYCLQSPIKSTCKLNKTVSTMLVNQFTYEILFDMISLWYYYYHFIQLGNRLKMYIVFIYSSPRWYGRHNRPWGGKW